MRALIFELGHDSVEGGLEGGLAAGLASHASQLDSRDGLTIDVQVPDRPIPLSPRAETQLFAIGREALSNVVKHAGARAAWVRVESRRGHAVVEIGDNGRGFDPVADHPGHFGLESMRSRAAEIGAFLTITSTPGRGTVVRVETPVEPERVSDDP
jgi:signal transduction histidine kinase